MADSGVPQTDRIGCVLKIRPRDIKSIEIWAITVFRIIQEALTNIIRHAGATEMDFTMDLH